MVRDKQILSQTYSFSDIKLAPDHSFEVKNIKEKRDEDRQVVGESMKRKVTVKIREQARHVTALLVEFKYGVDNDYETGANMKMATALVAHGINIAFRKRCTPQAFTITIEKLLYVLGRRDLNALRKFLC